MCPRGGWELSLQKRGKWATRTIDTTNTNIAKHTNNKQTNRQEVYGMSGTVYDNCMCHTIENRQKMYFTLNTKADCYIKFAKFHAIHQIFCCYRSISDAWAMLRQLWRGICWMHTAKHIVTFKMDCLINTKLYKSHYQRLLNRSRNKGTVRRYGCVRETII